MRVLAIDPGPTDSACVVWDGTDVWVAANYPNLEISGRFSKEWFGGLDLLVIEQIRGFGVPGSNALFDTCWWAGRFFEAWGDGAHMLPRADVLKHLQYGGSGNKDKAVREALIARIGPVGTKKAPGPLYGISGHLFAALAVAVTFYDLHAEEKGNYGQG